MLRAKYLDWCSARVAERFVKLTPEEIYALAEQATRAGTESPGDEGATNVVSVAASGIESPAAADASPSFKSIVERVTEVLASELALPPFSEWARAYRKDPAKFDAELLGLWREPL